MKANTLSLLIKGIAGTIMVVSLFLKSFKVIDIPMQEVVYIALALEALVLPIDISKIKEHKFNG